MSRMRSEVEEIPQAVGRLLAGLDPGPAVAAFRARDPVLLATVARGSSDHAAHFLRYAFELGLGLPGASPGPSLASVYGRVPRLGRAVVLAVSQSGGSPDIVAMAAAARQAGACCIALVNTPGSPLAGACDLALDIGAGPELSVAATKSFVCSVVAGLVLLAELAPDPGLRAALAGFPDRLGAALAADWPLAAPLAGAASLFVLGRGPSLAIAAEVALKFKEVCGVHAEAFSAAEVLHGPVELVGPGFPVLVLAGRDEAQPAAAALADDLAARGAAVWATSGLCRQAGVLPVPPAGHPLLDALVQVVPAYLMLEALARRRGRDPDAPARLRKVTRTR